MSPADTTEREVELSLARAELTGGGVLAEEARRAINYYDSTLHQADDLYEQLEPLYANKAKWKARPKAVYNITAGITDAISTLYTDPVVYTFEDARAAALWDQVKGWASVMHDVDRYTFLGGILGLRPVVQDGAVSFNLYHADQIEYVQDPEDVIEAQQITVRWLTGQGYLRHTVAQHWTDEQYAETVDDVLTGPISDNPYGEIPIVMFRNVEPRWDFWGYPASDLVAANLALNEAMTHLNHTMRWQTHGQLVLVGAPPSYTPPIGPDTYISVSNATGSTGADARYINPGADIAAIVNGINQNLDMVFSARRIPKSAVIAVQGDSGVSLVGQQAALRDYRKNRIATLRPREERAIALTLKVMHYHLTGELREFDPPQIKYTLLEAPMEDERRLDWDWKLGLGIASPVDIMLSLYPHMSEAEAEEKIRKNLAGRREQVMGEIGGRREVRPAAEVDMADADEDEDEEDEEDGEED